MKKRFVSICIIILTCVILGSNALASDKPINMETYEEEVVITRDMKYKVKCVTFSKWPPEYIDYCELGWGGRLYKMGEVISNPVGTFTACYSGYLYSGGCLYSTPVELE